MLWPIEDCCYHRRRCRCCGPYCRCLHIINCLFVGLFVVVFGISTSQVVCSCCFVVNVDFGLCFVYLLFAFVYQSTLLGGDDMAMYAYRDAVWERDSHAERDGSSPQDSLSYLTWNEGLRDDHEHNSFWYGLSLGIKTTRKTQHDVMNHRVGFLERCEKRQWVRLTLHPKTGPWLDHTIQIIVRLSKLTPTLHVIVSCPFLSFVEGERCRHDLTGIQTYGPDV